MGLITAAKATVGAFFPGKIWVYLAVATALYLGGGYSGWKVHGWKEAKSKLAVAEKTIAIGTKQTGTDNKLAGDRVKTVTIYKQAAAQFIKETIYETAAVPGPVVCDAPAERMSNFSAAIDAANAAR